jgi:hypothetical protein
MKNIYGQGSLFIGAEGGGVVPENRLASTVVSFSEDACPLRHSEGDVFFTKVQKFSWKQIVGVNPLPRGASVGELGKSLKPSKRRIAEIHETGSRSNYGRKAQFYEKG